ncbi:hypothetical protein LTR62_004446 [Meristemomyces frigidus]|uniref:N-acetyltransferase domain-containing protein n=1 Tax=Meristemomyces frigidus TaxID=1508187 RepID=A0AAN7TEJ8_9PEZI|nr:hypothetical protein LTR62_004446 [Meristemomyces frigidus]
MEDGVQHGNAVVATGKTIIDLPDHISVREWRHTDAASAARHGNNIKIWNNLRNRMPHPYLEENAAGWINFCSDITNHRHTGTWTQETGGQGPAVSTGYTIAVNDEAVGSIGLNFADEKDVYLHQAELGYWLSEEHWGKGVMSKVVPAFVNWAFKTFRILLRINGATHEKNLASAKLLQKAGFQFEGRRPDFITKNGVTAAELMWGVLRPKEGDE